MITQNKIITRVHKKVCWQIIQILLFSIQLGQRKLTNFINYI